MQPQGRRRPEVSVLAGVPPSRRRLPGCQTAAPLASALFLGQLRARGWLRTRQLGELGAPQMALELGPAGPVTLQGQERGPAVRCRVQGRRSGGYQR